MRSARGFWVLVAIAGVVAVVVANVALLGLATERNDPVGRLQPVAALDVTTPPGTVPEPTPSTPATTTSTAPEPTPVTPTTTTGHDGGDDHGGSPGGEPDD